MLNRMPVIGCMADNGHYLFDRGDQSPLQSPYQSPWVTDNVRCFGQSQFLLINRNIRDSQSQPLYRAIDTSHRLSFVIDFPIAFSVGANTLDSAFFFELFYSLCYRFSADLYILYIFMETFDTQCVYQRRKSSGRENQRIQFSDFKNAGSAGDFG